MSENAKTITYVVVGLLAVALGLLTAPSSAKLDESSLVGTTLKFETPDLAKRMRIVRFDSDTAKTREFEVAEQHGLWTIPSKEGYPADAARQMGEAVNQVRDRKVLAVISNNQSDHEEYGVIDPLMAKLEPGQKGVGTRVMMSDGDGKTLIDLIVGKEVRDQEKQHYVRVAGQDVVYAVEIDPSKLSTSFEDWIEKDLLKLQTWDLQQVQIKDYSAEMGIVQGPDGSPQLGVALKPRAELTLGYSDSDSKWSPVKLRAYERKPGQRGTYVDFKLAADEELNAESLNGLKNALGDLKIVDVERKPQGLSQDLKAGADFLTNNEARRDLIGRGFAIAQPPGSNTEELLSSDGEVTSTLKNGTKYVLRFGGLTEVSGSGQEKDEKAKAKDAKTNAKNKAGKSDKSDVHRYLFVMAEFDKSAITPPAFEKLPDLPAKPEAKPGAPAPAAASDKSKEKLAKSEQKPADATAAKKEDTAKKTDTPNSKTDSAKKEDASSKKKEDGKKDQVGKGASPSDKDAERIMAERMRIETENQRKQKDYDELVKKGQENVKNLNLRFGDWYFVVNDDVFHKIRLSRDEVIKKKEKKADAAKGEKKDTASPGAGIPGLPPIPDAKK
jgi:hypothetical protein